MLFLPKKRLLAFVVLPCITLAALIITTSLTWKRIHKPEQKRLPAYVNVPQTFPDYEYLNPYLSGKPLVLLEESKRTLIETKILKVCNSYLQNNRASDISIYFCHIGSEKEININPVAKYAPASLLKLDLLIAVLKASEMDNSLLKRKLPIDVMVDAGTQTADENESFMYVRNQQYDIEELCRLMIVYSDNTATIQLINFLEKNNPGLLDKTSLALKAEVPKSINMNEDLIRANHFSYALKALYNASFLGVRNSGRSLELLCSSRYKHGIRAAVPSNFRVAQKHGVRFNTGPGAENPVQLHNIALVYHPAHPFILTVMTKGNDLQTLRKLINEVTTVVWKEIDTP